MPLFEEEREGGEERGEKGGLFREVAEAFAFSGDVSRCVVMGDGDVE